MAHDHQPAPELPIDPDLPAPIDPRDARGPRRPQRRWDIALVIAVGGAIGGALRYALNEAIPHGADGFPWATFLENVTGCLVLGALMVYLLDVWSPHRYARPFLAVGLLGGFTTFSAYTVETATLLRSGHAPTAFAYLGATIVAGLVATWAGIAVARRAAGIRPRST